MLTRSNRHVLIVDDDDATRDALRELFEGAGYVVRTAANGSAGIGTLRAMATSRVVVLLDLMMAGSDGFDFLERLAQIRASFDGIRILVFTGHARAAAKALLQNVDEVLRKPLPAGMLLDAVARQFEDLAIQTVGVGAR